MIAMIDPTGEGIVVNCSTSSFKPCKQTSPNVRRDLELHRTASLLLDDHGTDSDFCSCHESDYFDFNEIATAKLALKSGAALAAS